METGSTWTASAATPQDIGLAPSLIFANRDLIRYFGAFPLPFDGMRRPETIESSFARRKCALVSSPEFGGTGISGVIAEFLLGEMDAKKRTASRE